MYRHQIFPFGNFQRQQIINNNNGNSISFVAERGATIVDIQFGGRSILDGCESGLELDLNNWGKSGILFPFPNRLEDGTYTWKDQQYQFPINDSLTGNALHGFLMDKAFDIVEIGLHAEEAYIKCLYRYQGDNAAFPFPFDFNVCYEISDRNTFQVEFSIENTGPSSFPLGLGWHPYFKTSDKVDQSELQMDHCKLVGVDARMIPTGKLYDFNSFDRLSPIKATVLDNCFVVAQPKNGKFEVKLKGQNGQIDYWQETGNEQFNFVQIFTPPSRKSIAIEPMSCNVNAFNNKDGLKILEQEEIFVIKTGLTFTPM